ncbi:MAG: hypothetical protein RBU29_16605, partial [bacterium]|nr:hypothetical protein [bacterium]
SEEEDGLRQHTISLPTPSKRQATVALRIEQTRGYYGGSTIPDPIRLQCGVGETTTGDWAIGSVLQNYSGGAWYRKTFSLTKEQTRGRVVINLGDVVATAAIHINGAHAGTLVAPPWKWDITQHVQVGENQLQILVYNTLANHYSTIPTRYGGDLKSGLLGPVQVEMQSPVILTEVH